VRLSELSDVHEAVRLEHARLEAILVLQQLQLDWAKRLDQAQNGATSRAINPACLDAGEGGWGSFMHALKLYLLRAKCTGLKLEQARRGLLLWKGSYQCRAFRV
jgi:hypothetical protein